MARHAGGKLERAKWHVEFGSRHIARQCEIIEQMRQIGNRTDLAKRALAALVTRQIDYKAHLNRLLEEKSDAMLPAAGC